MTIQDEITTTRREFLAGALGAAVAAGALGALPLPAMAAESAPATAAPALAQKLKLGLATYQWGMDWDIPTLIANLQKAKVYGVELRTQSKYKHGVELELNAQQRAEVKKQFADSPVKVVSIACSERMDWPQPEKLKAAIEAAKGYLKLSADIGSSSLRVFPNQWNQGVPHEQTIAQIAKALNELGAYAAGIGQRVDIEAHGPAGDLATMKAIMDQVTEKSVVGVRLNCDKRDTTGEGLEAQFNMVKNVLAHTIHIHNLKDPQFPYQQFVNLLAQANWEGWALMEDSDKVPDRLQAIIEQREIWDTLLAKAQPAEAPRRRRKGRKGKKQ